MNRNDFPILNQNVYNKPLVYFDNAATTQKPLPVIEALSDYYKSINSNIHRGVHFLSQKATEEFEVARKAVQQFIHAAHDYEVIFTRGATESINLVAGRTSNPATRSSFPRWSTTPTSYPGSSCAKTVARCSR